ASEKAKHYYLKINGTEEYDIQNIFRQHYGNLSKWSLNTILSMLKLNPKDGLLIEKMYDILYNCYNRKYGKEEKKKLCTIILKYCIRDCIAPKEAYEYINKITEYRLITDLTIIPFYLYSFGNKTKMINNIFVNLSYQENFGISFKYNRKNTKKKYKGGFVHEPQKGFSSIADGILDFNSLYP
ncbi:1949_t:CDS:1, partial [Cetraspora pellucida]